MDSVIKSSEHQLITTYVHTNVPLYVHTFQCEPAANHCSRPVTVLMPIIDVLDLTEAGLIQPAKKAHPRVSYTDYSGRLAHVNTQLMT